MSGVPDNFISLKFTIRSRSECGVRMSGQNDKNIKKTIAKSRFAFLNLCAHSRQCNWKK